MSTRTMVDMATHPGIGTIEESTADWVARFGGLAGWIVVLVLDGRFAFYLRESTLHVFPKVPYTWDGDGLELFQTRQLAEAAADRINQMTAEERIAVGPLGTVAVAYFGRWDNMPD